MLHPAATKNFLISPQGIQSPSSHRFRHTCTRPCQEYLGSFRRAFRLIPPHHHFPTFFPAVKAPRQTESFNYTAHLGSGAFVSTILSATAIYETITELSGSFKATSTVFTVYSTAQHQISICANITHRQRKKFILSLPNSSGPRLLGKGSTQLHFHGGEGARGEGSPPMGCY